MKTPRKPRTPKVIKLENLKHLNLHAAGLDIGASETYACVPEDGDSPSVRVFQTFTVDLYAVADWLAACGVPPVALASTGVYWIPVYAILDARGVAVHVINARQLKNVPGRKTDVLDCPWIQQLHTYGLLRGSFRPNEDMVALRAYIRPRDPLLRYRSAHVQHMQKALLLMNVQLTNVLSDITGVTGLQIIRAMVRGARHPHTLAAYRHEPCAKSEEDIAKALTGHYRPEHLFALTQALELYDVYNQQITTCDQEIAPQYAAFKPPVDLAETPLPSRKPKRNKPQGNEPTFDLRSDLYRLAGVDLTQVDGLQVLTVQTILSEIGLDMHRWPTVKHFTSWLGLAPYQDISGGKTLRTGTKKTTNRAATAFRLAAQSLHSSHSALGGFYRRMRATHGAPKAIVATAHKLARIVYHLLTSRQAYSDPGPDYYEEKYRDRTIRNLKRKAHQLGLDLVPVTA